jgi:hypothetical protein
MILASEPPLGAPMGTAKRHGDRRSARYSSDPGSPQVPIHVHSPSTHAGVPHRQLKAPVQPPLGLARLETGSRSPQLPMHVHSPSTHAGVPHKQLKAPVQPLGGGFAARHVPVHVGGIELVQATTEQTSPASQPVVMGGLPVTLQRWPSASAAVPVDPSSMSAAEHPSDASSAPRATAEKPTLTRVRMMVQVSLVLGWSKFLTALIRAARSPTWQDLESSLRANA